MGIWAEIGSVICSHVQVMVQILPTLSFYYKRRSVYVCTNVFIKKVYMCWNSTFCSKHICKDQTSLNKVRLLLFQYMKTRKNELIFSKNDSEDINFSCLYLPSHGSQKQGYSKFPIYEHLSCELSCIYCIRLTLSAWAGISSHKQLEWNSFIVQRQCVRKKFHMAFTTGKK